MRLKKRMAPTELTIFLDGNRSKSLYSNIVLKAHIRNCSEQSHYPYFGIL